MGMNLAHKLIKNHLVSGKMNPGEEIGLKIDQTLTQDATGTMVMLELEAMQIAHVKTELSVQYVDHNLLQTDFKNADDHVFLRSAARKFGIWYSRPGNGVSHPVHMERFGIPGKSLLGSDSHTPAAGSLGMLAIGAGGLEVAVAMAGNPFFMKMPKVFGVKLIGKLPPWVSAKDVILEMLRRHGVAGGKGKIIEYYGPGLEHLTAMDRHVIANMGAELGASTTVFPSDHMVKTFLTIQKRQRVWTEILADAEATYDESDEIDLSSLEPLIALPGSPGNVVPVREVAGKEINQAYIGSSANPGFRDFAIPALILEDRQVAEHVSLDINPTSRQILINLVALGFLEKLIKSGARIHQPGCNGCIGMGQAPASGKISLRTVPRNFPGRSGTENDAVYLCSPETAAVSALFGVITDPREAIMDYPIFAEPLDIKISTETFIKPSVVTDSVDLEKGPNIKSLPNFDPMPELLQGPVLLKMGDNISTDEIMPAGSAVLPYRSNIHEISKFSFRRIDANYYDRAIAHKKQISFVIAGSNYGQGSSREHAAIAPRYLGLRAVIAKDFARIHRKNLINFGILPLSFENPDDWNKIDQDDGIRIPDVRNVITAKTNFDVLNTTKSVTFRVKHDMTEREIKIVLNGSLISFIRKNPR
ncbi:MAG: aconitate hydratase [Desulfobacterales bacterium]